VEVRLGSAKLQQIAPGRIVTGSYLVANQSGRDEELVEQVTLPAGWRKIAPTDSPFSLKAGEKQVRLVAVSLPATAVAGQFEIGYAVKRRGETALLGATTFSVEVLPVAKLELLGQGPSTAVLAGDEYEVGLQIVNRGNSRSVVRFEITGSPNYPVSGLPPETSLEPGAAQPLRLRVKTDPALRNKLTHILNVKATAGEGVSASQSFSVEVLPAVTGSLDPYHRLPAQLRIMGAKDSDRDFAGQVELSGAGSLDEAGKHKVDFLFRGPDMQQASVFGQREEYRFSYFNPLYDFALGDRNFFLSPLTERYGYGRGAEFNVHPDRLGFGLFYMQQPWVNSDFQEVGTHLTYNFSPAISLRGNFLDRGDGSAFITNGVANRVFSIQPYVKLGKWMAADLELAGNQPEHETGSAGFGYRVDLRGEPAPGFSYAVERVYAAPGFFGAYHDSEATAGSLTFPIHRKLRGTLAVNDYANNLDSDPTRGPVASREQFYRPGLAYTLPWKIDASVEYQRVRRQDVLAPADYDSLENSVRVGLGRGFGKFSVSTFIEVGAFEDYRPPQRQDPVGRYSVYASYRPTPRQSYSLFTRIGSSAYSAAPEDSYSFGVGGNWTLTRHLAANVQLSLNRYDGVTGREQHMANGSLQYTLPNQHKVAVSGRWTQTSTTKETESAVFLVYTIPLSLPVSRKQSIGRLQGRVFDVEQARPLSRVLLRANESTAVTDRNGEFIFPALTPGSYMLRVEQGSIGVERVATEVMPLMVEVKKAGVTRVEIGVVTAGQVSVCLTVFGSERQVVPMPAATNGVAAAPGMKPPAAADARTGFHELGPFEAGLVELANGKEVLRQLTDRNGRASFEHLRPGKWVLKVYENNLPQFHYLEKSEAQIELKPGGKAEVSIRILPKARAMRVIDQGVIK